VRVSELKKSTPRWLAAALLLTLFAGGCSDSNAPPPLPGELSDSWILFNVSRSNGLAIFAILPDGRGLRLVTSGTAVGGWQAFNPSWSRDGNQIAYVTQPSTFQTWVMRTDQSETHQIATSAICSPPLISMSWSPTGDRIIGDCSTAPYPRHQYVINVADGTNYSLDQRWGRTAGSADWSPIDDRILYVTGGADIHVANLDGSGDALVLSAAFVPKWSPDATRIAFVRKSATGNAAYAIFVANADGSGAKQVSFPADSFYDSGPSWSHDGKQIVFTREGSAPSHALHVINADGSGEKKITPDSLSANGASW
jgi:Tol biopolymer transport system component